VLQLFHSRPFRESAIDIPEEHPETTTINTAAAAAHICAPLQRELPVRLTLDEWVSM